MNSCDLIKMAKGFGFDGAAETDPGLFRYMPEVRDMCKADKCKSYNRSWSCPPACGTLERISEKAAGYDKCILVQTVGRRRDEYDFEFYADTAARHNENFRAFVSALRKDGADIFPMGTGSCRLCGDCSYPDAPCRLPEESFPSMEACGLLVSKVCEDAGLRYYYGPESIAYTGCCLYSTKSNRKAYPVRRTTAPAG